MVKQNRTNSLPDLARGTEIVAENLRAVQTIYIAAMLEELKVFQLQRLSAKRALLRIRKPAKVRARLGDFQFSARVSDNELANACEQWLAVNGVTDDQIEQQIRPGMAVRGTTRT